MNSENIPNNSMLNKYKKIETPQQEENETPNIHLKNALNDDKRHLSLLSNSDTPVSTNT